MSWTFYIFLNVTQNRLEGIQTNCVQSGSYILTDVLIVLKFFSFESISHFRK